MKEELFGFILGASIMLQFTCAPQIPNQYYLYFDPTNPTEDRVAFEDAVKLWKHCGAVDIVVTDILSSEDVVPITYVKSLEGKKLGEIESVGLGFVPARINYTHDWMQTHFTQSDQIIYRTSIFAHELGHLFGLDHSDDVKNVMYKISPVTAIITQKDCDMVFQLRM